MSYKAALCTSDGNRIDLHFGQTRRFLMIEVDDGGGWTRLGWRDAPERLAGQEHCLEWFDAVAQLLADADYVFCEKIGPKPHRSLTAAGISPLETPPDIDESVAAITRYRSRMSRR